MKNSMSDVFPDPELPPENAVDVWVIEQDRLAALPINFEALLSAPERERAGRFVKARDTERFKVCRAMLRLGLAWYLHLGPREVVLTTGRRGKPRLLGNSPLHFNVTHSDGLALIAFTAVGDVGIDVEIPGRDVEALEIASAYFTENETARIAAAGAEGEQASTFLRFWTRKEAVLKAAGLGIAEGLNMIDVSGEPPRLVQLGGEGADALWLVQDIEGIDGVIGAVAAPPGNWSIRLWRFSAATERRFFASFPGV